MTRCQLLLSLLEDAGERGITTSEILEAGVGSRYGARLMELRKQGHRITSERVREGSWRYVLEPHTAADFYPHHINSEDELLPEWRPANQDGEDDLNVRGAAGEVPSTADLTLKLFESAA